MSGAVFLSYASQDAEAARRICESLRAAGVEVWFDQSELRGGDSWDQKIHRQIRECALFVPVISGNTQSRGEGYFRREWKLAVERTHDMADHVPFLVPVVLDATTDREAHVPERFRATQWTRLPGGETPAAFADRIRGLAAGGGSDAAPERKAAPAAAALHRLRPAPRRWVIPAAACVGAVIALVLWSPWKKTRAGGTTSAQPAAILPKADSATPDVKAADSPADANSVAVLPFKNMSDDKENEYFSDGISEELLTVLEKVPGLHVAAQTSAFYFKGKNVMAQEIGRQLRVANLVEGSVQKFGNRVRISARLSRAETGDEIWAVTFPPREVTDVFALQDEIAQSIVAELRGRLGADASNPTAKAEIAAEVQAAEKGGTKNAEAHELYLQGLFLTRQFSREAFGSAVEKLRRATQLDPSFALAWAALSNALSLQWAWTTVSTPAVMVECHDAARRAIQLQPGLVEGYDALFAIQTSYEQDPAGAAASIRKAIELAPGNATVIGDAGILATAFGDIPRAAELFRRALALDPLNTEFHIFVAEITAVGGDDAGACAEAEKVLAYNPNAPLVKGLEATILAEANQRLPEALALANAEKENWTRFSSQALVLWRLKRVPEADEALKHLIDSQANSAAYQISEVYSMRGDTDKAFEWLNRAVRQHDAGLGWSKVDPVFEPLHKDPRWPILLKTLGVSGAQPD